MVDAAIRLPASRIHHRVDRHRRARPGASPAEIIARLEKEYRFQVAGIGGAVGATAAVPGLGTAVALGVAGVQLAEYLTDTSLHAMALADVHGVPLEDLERRRTLLLATLLGPEGAELMQEQLGLTTLFWARSYFTKKLPITTVRAINKRLRTLALNETTRIAGHAVGRMMPFGIGAAIGYTAARKLASEAIEGARLAFGPAPTHFTRQIGEHPQLAQSERLFGDLTGPA